MVGEFELFLTQKNDVWVKKRAKNAATAQGLVGSRGFLTQKSAFGLNSGLKKQPVTGVSTQVAGIFMG